MTCLTCCCLYGRDETFTTPVQVSEKNQYCLAVAKTLRKFFSSIGVYCYVLLLTFFLTILLLAELLLALKIIVVQEAQRLDNESVFAQSNFDSRQSYVLYVIHWTNFSLLSLCLLEVLLRVFAWKLDLVKSGAAACDCAAVTISFVVNIVTTAAAGFDSPFNAISLIIVFRFVRIISLMEVSTRRVKVFYQEKLAQSESSTAVLQVANQKLSRQISEKDYEIKQLRGHLGKLDEETRRDLMGEWQQKRENDARYDDELEKALALSKKEYEEVHGGFSNPSYIDHTQQSEGFFMSDITVHRREDSVRRSADIPSTSKLHPASSGDTGNASVKKTFDPKISHGDLHAGTDLDGHRALTDTTLLLESREDKRNSDHKWTVGYCLIEPQHPDLISTKLDFQTNSDKKSGLDQVDEGIGDESFSPVKRRIKHRKALGTNPSPPDDTLSDQGCVSAASVCSESGYQSEERISFNPPLDAPSVPLEEHSSSASSSDINRSFTSGDNIAMSELGEKRLQEIVNDKSEEEL